MEANLLRASSEVGINLVESRAVLDPDLSNSKDPKEQEHFKFVPLVLPSENKTLPACSSLENQIGELSLEAVKLKQYDKTRREFVIILGSSGLLCAAIIVLDIISSGYWMDVDRPNSFREDKLTLSAYSVHVLFMTLAITVFSSYGILLYRILPELPMWIIKWIHGSIFSFASLFLVFGVLKAFDHFEPFVLENFSTLHSWLGIAVVMLFIVEVITGCVFIFYPEANRSNNTRFQKVHRHIGQSLFLLSLSTSVTGIDRMICVISASKSSDKPGRTTQLSVLGFLTVVFYLTILLLMFFQRYKRKARPTWRCIYNNPTNTEMSTESSKTVIHTSQLFTTSEH